MDIEENDRKRKRREINFKVEWKRERERIENMVEKENNREIEN